MKILEIEFKNYRSFRGVKKISFDPHETKNINLILARNITGKTNVMNSVLWTLHGKTTEALEDPHLIINRAVGEYKKTENGNFEYTKKVSAYVQIKIIHRSETYVIKREISSESSKTSVVVQKVTGGNYKKIPGDPGVFINKLVPESMSELFIFDGERAKKLMEITNKRTKASLNVKEAIRTVLGCETADTAISYLNAKELSIKNKIINLGGEKLSDDLKGTKKRIIELRGDEDNPGIIFNSKKELEALKKANDDFDTELDTLRREAKKFDNLEAFLKTKEALNKNVGLSKTIKNTAEKNYREWLSSRECLDHLMRKPTFDAIQFFNDNEAKKERKPLNHFPAPHGPEYIRSILKAKVCICGTEFEENDDIYDLIQKQILSATDEKSSSAYTFAKNYSETATNKTLSLTDYNDHINKLRSANKKYDGDKDLRKAHGEFDGDDSKGDSNELNRDIDEIDGKIRGNIGKISLLNQEIKNDGDELSRLEDDLKQKQGNSLTSEKFNKQIALVQAVRDSIQLELDSYEETARKSIEKLVQKTLYDYFDSQNSEGKSSKFLIQKDYKIQFDTPMQQRATKSAGLNVLLSLIFTSALIKYCKGRENLKNINEDSDSILLPGIEIPLIIDSPFADVDDQFRGPLAKVIKETGVQVIFCVSMAQFPKDIKDELKSNVQNVWGLQKCNTSSPPKKGNPGELIWEKKKIPAYLYNKAYEETFVEKIK